MTVITLITLLALIAPAEICMPCFINKAAGLLQPGRILNGTLPPLHTQTLLHMSYNISSNSNSKCFIGMKYMDTVLIAKA